MTETPNVQTAWANVMADVRALGKGQAVTSGPARFNFRGVDDVMNAVGPVLRDHGVSVVPTAVSHTAEDVTTSKGSKMRNVTVIVSYQIHGPAGDTMAGAAAGEAADSGDKATPKAMSVAFRTFLLQSLTLPTDEPDPDLHQYERAPEPTPQELAAQVAQGIAAATTEAGVREWGNRAHARGLLDLQVGALPLREHVTARLAALDAQSEGVTA
jgi:hypothetical protein